MAKTGWDLNTRTGFEPGSPPRCRELRQSLAFPALAPLSIRPPRAAAEKPPWQPKEPLSCHHVTVTEPPHSFLWPTPSITSPTTGSQGVPCLSQSFRPCSHEQVRQVPADNNFALLFLGDLYTRGGARTRHQRSRVTHSTQGASQAPLFRTFVAESITKNMERKTATKPSKQSC